MTPRREIPKTASPPVHPLRSFPRIGLAPCAVLVQTYSRRSNTLCRIAKELTTFCEWSAPRFSMGKGRATLVPKLAPFTSFSLPFCQPMGPTARACSSPKESATHCRYATLRGITPFISRFLLQNKNFLLPLHRFMHKTLILIKQL